MIKLIKPYISFDDVETQFRSVFESGWFTKGSHVAAFRSALSEYTKASHAHLTTSATTALTMCLRLLDVREGDEVIVSDFSFPATANVVEDLRATPVFADVDPDTFNMTVEELRACFSERTKAVIFVDALGNPTGLHAIKAICKEKQIPLIEDAACALGSSENGSKCGKIADATCFSFHPRKLLTTGEGGAVLTDNSEWNDWLSVKLEHGAVSRDGRFDFVDYGYNYRLPELQAVMGLVQLAKLDDITARRNRMKSQYITELTPAGFTPQSVGPDVVHNCQSVVFVVPDHIDRDVLIADMRALGVETTIGTYSLSGCTYFTRKYQNPRPVAGRLMSSTITLPCHDDVDVGFVCERLLQSVRS